VFGARAAVAAALRRQAEVELSMDRCSARAPLQVNSRYCGNFLLRAKSWLLSQILLLGFAFLPDASGLKAKNHFYFFPPLRSLQWRCVPFYLRAVSAHCYLGTYL